MKHLAPRLLITTLLFASRQGNCLWGGPERESRTPLNIGNRLYCDNGEGVALCLSLTHLTKSAQSPLLMCRANDL